MNGRWSTILAALALVVLAIAVGTLITVLTRPQTIAAAPNTSALRQITVIGQGEARATPDTAVVQLGVQTEAESARQALNDNNTQMQALIAKLKELGIAEKDMQTSNVSIWPRYDNDGRAILGYQVSNTLTIKIRDVAQTSNLLDQVVDAGANNLSGITFTINDPAALEQQARDAAISNARARAEAMAQATGASIGQILSINENIGATPVPLMRAEAANMAADMAGVPVQTGEQTITAQVQITFELQ